MSLVLFVCMLFVGAMALAVALALAATELVGSAILAWLIVALLFVVGAIVVYYVSLHATIKRINNRLETIYEVSATVERCFQSVALYLKNVVNNFFK